MLRCTSKIWESEISDNSAPTGKVQNVELEEKLIVDCLKKKNRTNRLPN
jgi:hypothetical protein